MSEFNISIESGTSKRLPVGNKWSEKDIIVTATGGAEDLTEVLTEQDELIDQIKTALAGKIAGGGGGSADGGADVASKLVDRTVTEAICNTATAIGAYSFRGCKSLRTVVAPNATSVGEYAFYQCNKLTSIVLPSVTTVSTNSFRDAQYLEFVDLPKLTAISSNTFYGCRGLKTLILRYSKKVTLNATNAFTSCYRMLGTKNSGFNPNGERLGFVYVPRALVSEYQADATWTTLLETTQFRAIEDYPDICG